MYGANNIYIYTRTWILMHYLTIKLHREYRNIHVELYNHASAILLIVPGGQCRPPAATP